MKKKKYSKQLLQQETSQPVQQPRKKKTLLYVFGGFIILIMVGSIIGLYSQEDTTSAKYNGHAFTPYGNGWVVRINNQDLQFAYHPKDLEPYAQAPLNLGQKVYILFNPKEEDQNNQELQRIAAYLNFAGKAPNFACTQEDGCGDLPIIDCTQHVSAIHYKRGNQTRFSTENTCTILEYNPAEPTQATELAAYKILGIL